MKTAPSGISSSQDEQTRGAVAISRMKAIFAGYFVSAAFMASSTIAISSSARAPRDAMASR